MNDDIVARLADLHKQATEERSHYYVARVVKDAIAEIETLRAGMKYGGSPCPECGLPVEACNIIALMRHALNRIGRGAEIQANVIRDRGGWGGAADAFDAIAERAREAISETMEARL